jgi:mannosyl-3-phosphoglycerate phosphatase
VVENGGALCFPLDLGYPFALAEAHETVDGHALIRFSPAYAEIRDFITRQRNGHGYKLLGFGDMSVAERARNTGLDLAAAARAGQRLCSEPLVWLDSAMHLERFRAAAHAAGLTLTRGGRFWHLMGDTSKARGLVAMRSLFSTGQAEAPTVIALGDSDNDREMLRSADIAVVVRRPDGSRLDGCNGIRRTLVTGQPGPAGWNQAVLEILNELGFKP